MKIQDNVLYLNAGDQVPFVQTKNMGGVIRPLYLVIHYTASTNAASAAEWFSNPISKVSAHLIIDRDGTATQMVPFNKRAWHAGVSQWGTISDLNSHSIGIELVNAGKLRKRSDGKWLTDYGREIPAEEVTEAMHNHEQISSGWHEYTEAQLRTLTEIGLALVDRYKLLDILGHDDIAPTRKVDPGPLFPMNGLRSRILGRMG